MGIPFPDKNKRNVLISDFQNFHKTSLDIYKKVLGPKNFPHLFRVHLYSRKNHNFDSDIVFRGIMGLSIWIFPNNFLSDGGGGEGFDKTKLWTAVIAD